MTSICCVGVGCTAGVTVGVVADRGGVSGFDRGGGSDCNMYI